MGLGGESGGSMGPAAELITEAPNDGTQFDLDYSEERIAAAFDAGMEYINGLESIRDALNTTGHTGTTLGRMVAAQLEMVELETQYMVNSSIPKKASQATQQAANDVKKAAGG